MGPLVFKTSGAALGAARWVRLPRAPATAQGDDTTLVIEKDWDEYYRATAGRAPRPLFDRAIATWGDRPPGQAVDLGSGDGTEALALLDRGWRVLAIDAHPASARLAERAAPSTTDRLTTLTASFETVQLPPSDLVYAGFSLPFLSAAALATTWAAIRVALLPAGVVAVNLFGPRDTWHTDPTMTFLEGDAVERLADGLEVVWFHEREEDGEATTGPKHWHVFELIARGRAERDPTT